MSRQKQAKKLLPIIQAIADGKKLEYSFNGESWLDEDFDFELDTICKDIIVGSCDYRIKPEEKSCKWCSEKIPQNDGSYVCKNRDCELVKKLTETTPITAEQLEGHYWDEEKKYRAFKNCDELISTWEHKVIEPLSNVKYNDRTGFMFMPTIWVKEKDYGISQLITGFGDTVVKFSPDYTITLKSLFENYTFLDSSVIGKEEE